MLARSLRIDEPAVVKLLSITITSKTFYRQGFLTQPPCATVHANRLTRHLPRVNSSLQAFLLSTASQGYSKLSQSRFSVD